MRLRVFTAALPLVAVAILGLLTAEPLHAAEGAPDAYGVVEQESGYYYTIRKGDTLWGLSQRFANSPWQWPALWEQNQQIANPHRIFPGQRIRLYKKKWAEKLPQAPPEPLPAVAPPPSFRYMAMDQVGFIRKSPVPPSGTIVKAKQGPLLIAEWDTVFIQPALPNPFRVGDRYVAYRTYPLGGHPPAVPHIGVQHLLTGLVEITKVEREYVHGRVVKNFRKMADGDRLMPFVPRSTDILLQKEVPSLEGAFIAGEDHDRYMGQYFTAFIDKGSNDGVKPGQSYMLCYDETIARTPGSRISKPIARLDFGRFLVLHAEAETATVLITEAEKEFFYAGTLFRSPQ
jgi:hypothetical protein